MFFPQGAGMNNESDEEKSRELRSSNLPDVSRRQFIQWSSLVMGWAAVAQAAQPLNSAANSSAGGKTGSAVREMVTLLDDGGFRHQGRGWEWGQGCELISAKDAPSPEVLHVKFHGSSTARATILLPESGKTYTVHGFMRTRECRGTGEGWRRGDEAWPI